MKKHTSVTLRKFLAAGIAMSAFGSIATAASIIEWNVDGYNYSGVAPDNVPPSAVDYAAFAPGASGVGFNLKNGADQSGGQTNLFTARISTAAPTLDTANLSSLRYTGFTVSADAGQQLNFESMTYGVAKSGTTAAHPTTAVWGYRIDDGSGFGAWTLQNAGAGFTLSVNGPTTSADLSTWNFADFSTTGTVEFGLWAWGGTNTAAAVKVISSIDSGLTSGLSVDGTVTAVPEPSTCILLGVGLGMFVFSRRRTNCMRN